jgi:hypothetical protein
MNAFLRRWLWVGVIAAIGLGIIAAVWLAGLAAGGPPQQVG